MLLKNNKLQSLLPYFKEKLKGSFSEVAIKELFYAAVYQYLNLSKVDVILNQNQLLTESEIVKFVHFCNRLNNKEPYQYILKSAHFYDLDFYVDENVLIPRPETEELVNWVLNDIQNLNALNIVDIGTGSGCIPISLSYHLKNKHQIFGLDISDEALIIASKNNDKNKTNVLFKKFDALNDKQVLIEESSLKLDVIISNPPYIPLSDKNLMEDNVLKYEPELALFTDNESPCIFYEKIAEFGILNLNKGGMIYFEIHENYAREVVSILTKLSYVNIEVKQDHQGKDRMIKAMLL